MNPVKRREIFERFRAANPEPRGELEYRTPFELLIAVILSAQATDKSVNLATRDLYKLAGTPRAMLALGLDGLIARIKAGLGLGLLQNKISRRGRAGNLLDPEGAGGPGTAGYE